MRHRFGKLNRRKLFLFGGLICLCLAGILYFSQNARKSQVAKESSRPQVQTYTVEKGDMMRHISLSGQTTADAAVSIAPKYTGRIVEVYVKLGDRVKAGDILLRQDTKDLELSIKQNQAASRQARADALETESTYGANFLKAQNDFVVKKAKYDRNLYLFSIGAISQETLDEIQQEYVTSKSSYDTLLNQVTDETPASIESKRAAVEKNEYGTLALEKQLDDLILRAPRDGIIAYRAAEVGAMATAGTKVLELIDNSRMYIDCQVSENDAAALEAGIELSANIDALGNSYPGKIIFVSPSMEDSAKTYKVRIELTKVPAMKAGMFARAQMDMLLKPAILFVPQAAILQKNGQAYVFVLDEDHMAKRRKVQLGVSNDEAVEIVDGLSAGDVVALSNQEKLKDDMQVDFAEAGVKS